MGLLVCAELFLNTDIILPDISVHKLDELGYYLITKNVSS